MATKPFIAEKGLMTLLLGTASSLAIAAPLADNSRNETALTDTSQNIGLYWGRASTHEKIGLVVMGVESTQITAAGISSLSASIQGGVSIGGDAVVTGAVTSTALAGTANNIVLHDAAGKLIDSGVPILNLSNYVLKSGDSMSGLLTLNARVTAPFGSGMNNERFGASAGNNSSTGSYNTAIGAGAMPNVTTGSWNNAVGAGTLASLTTGNNNVASGQGALASLVSGSNLIALGQGAAGSLVSGGWTVALGQGAIANATGLSECIFIGAFTGLGITSANVYDTILIGFYAGSGYSGAALATGAENIILGAYADVASPSQSRSITIGAFAVAPASHTCRIGDSTLTEVGTYGSFKMYGTTSGSTAIKVAANAGGNYTIVLPTTAGSSGQVLTTDGAGNTSWSTASAATIAGSIAATQVAYGSGVNTIQGSSNFTFVNGGLYVKAGATTVTPLYIQAFNNSQSALLFAVANYNSVVVAIQPTGRLDLMDNYGLTWNNADSHWSAGRNTYTYTPLVAGGVMFTAADSYGSGYSFGGYGGTSVFEIETYSSFPRIWTKGFFQVGGVMPASTPGNGIFRVSNNTSGVIQTLPSGTLSIITGADGVDARFLVGTYGTGNKSAISGRHARGTAAAPTASQLDDVFIEYGAWGYGTTGFSTAPRAMIQMLAGENWTDAAQGTRISFYTTTNGGTTTSERLRIWPDGGVSIGSYVGSSGAGSLGLNGLLNLRDNVGFTWANGDGNWRSSRNRNDFTISMVTGGWVGNTTYNAATNGTAFGGSGGVSALEIETAATPRIYSRGVMGIGIIPTYATAQLSVQTNAATVKGMLIKGYSFQSANFLEIQNDAAATYFYIDAGFNINLYGGKGIFYNQGDYNWWSGYDINLSGTPGSGIAMTTGHAVFYRGSSSSSNGYVWGIQGGNSQFELDFSTQRAYLRGVLGIGVVPAYATAQLSVQTNAATVKGVTIKGSASQSANLQEWQDSTGAVLSSVSSAGWLSVNQAVAATSPISVNTTASGNASCIDFYTSASGLNGTLYAIGTAANTGIGFNFPGASSGVLNWFFLRYANSTAKAWWGSYATTAGPSFVNQTPCNGVTWQMNLGIPTTTPGNPHMALYCPQFGASTANARLGINSGFIPAGTLDVIVQTVSGVPQVSANNGILDIGVSIAAFDGATAGKFAGSANGTYIAINTSSGFTGNLEDFQVNGVSKYKVDYLGAVTGSSITFPGSTSGSASIKAAATGTPATLVLPGSSGSNGQVLSTDGAGNLSWIAAGGGTPAGSNTQLQFNNSGAFGGSASLTWDGTTLYSSQLIVRSASASALNASESQIDVRATGSEGSFNGVLGTATYTGVGGSLTAFAMNGGYFQALDATSTISTTSTLVGVVGYARGGAPSLSTRAINQITGVQAVATVTGLGTTTVTQMIGVDINTTAVASTITTLMGLRVDTSTGNAATVTNRYGIRQIDANAINLFDGLLSAPKMKLRGSSSGSISIKAAAVAGAPADLTLPTTNGSSGNVLSTDGSGVLSWVAAGGIGGSLAANQVAVGAGVNTIAGSAALTFDGSTFTETNTLTFSTPADYNSFAVLTTVAAASGGASGPTATAIYGSITQAPTDALVPTLYGARFAASETGAGSTGAGTVYGMYAIGTQARTTGTSNIVFGGWLRASATANAQSVIGAELWAVSTAVTVTNLIGAEIQVASGTTTNGFGISLTMSGGTYTNLYGIYISTGSATATNKYGIYQVDAGVTNYFAGSVLSGTFFINTPQAVSVSATITSGRVKFIGSTVSQTLTLPAGISGTDCFIRNAATVAVTVARAGSDTIEGVPTFVLLPGEAISLTFVGTDWTIF